MQKPRWLHPDSVKKRLLDLGIASGALSSHQNFRKFIVLGRGRSGSNFLATSLETHPNIVSFGEVFNNLARAKGSVHFRYKGYNGQNRKQVQLRNEEPIRFIDESLFAPQPKAIQAVGFKLFYYHAKEPDWQPIWGHLQELGVCAIHIQRKNLLESLVSEEIAQATKTWSNRGGNRNSNSQKQAAPAQIDLSVDTCRTYFESIEKQREQYSNFFEQTLDLHYEDLLNNYEGELQRVQEFLGVPHHAVTSPLRKQAKRSIQESIGNFAELEREFAGTPWAWYFEPRID